LVFLTVALNIIESYVDHHKGIVLGYFKDKRNYLTIHNRLASNDSQKDPKNKKEKKRRRRKNQARDNLLIP